MINRSINKMKGIFLGMEGVITLESMQKRIYQYYFIEGKILDVFHLEINNFKKNDRQYEESKDELFMNNCKTFINNFKLSSSNFILYMIKLFTELDNNLNLYHLGMKDPEELMECSKWEENDVSLSCSFFIWVNYFILEFKKSYEISTIEKFKKLHKYYPHLICKNGNNLNTYLNTIRLKMKETISLEDLLLNRFHFEMLHSRIIKLNKECIQFNSQLLTPDVNNEENSLNAEKELLLQLEEEENKKKKEESKKKNKKLKKKEEKKQREACLWFLSISSKYKCFFNIKSFILIRKNSIICIQKNIRTYLQYKKIVLIQSYVRRKIVLRKIELLHFSIGDKVGLINSYTPIPKVCTITEINLNTKKITIYVSKNAYIKVFKEDIYLINKI